jgi:hypothetical protein
MLDEGHDQASSNPPALEPIAQAAVGSTPPVSGAALLRADLAAGWSTLDPDARRLVGASVAAFVIVLVGLPLSVWDSAPFALLVLTATVFLAVTGWFTTSPALRDLPIPRSTIELVATDVVAVLAVLKVVEILFDLGQDGIVALVISTALAFAAIAALVAAQRRGADPLAFRRGDQGARIAALGLLLVLVGWLLNLTISFWTMGQAALPLAVLTIAALTVAEAPRIPSPIPVAWVGAGIGAFGALLALGHWSDLVTLGRGQLALGAGDYLGLLVYSAGAALIIAGGVLSGRDTWLVAHPAPLASRTPPAPDVEA